MAERSQTASRGLFLGLLVFALTIGGAQQALAQLTYTVDRTVGAGHIQGTIVTNGRFGFLTVTDILGWNLSIDADGNGTFAPLPGPPTGIVMVQGNALIAQPTGLFWDFGNPGPLLNIFQIHTPDNSVVWQLQAMPPVMSDELIREAMGLQSPVPHAPGVEQIATLLVTPLEVTADTTLDADRRGPVVIAADNVTLDCAHHSVVGTIRDGIGIRAAGRRGITITRCVVLGFDEGIVLEDSSRSVLSENLTSESVSAGIRLTAAHRNRLTGNSISETHGPQRLANGLVLASSSNNRLEFNMVTYSDVTGILLSDGSAWNDLVANVSSFNRGSGFDVIGSASNRLLRNTAIENGDFGFVLRDQSKRNKLLENSACLNRPNDATEVRDDRRSNGNVWALNLFCSPSF
jgi:parallel beta-helix repeat protein